MKGNKLHFIRGGMDEVVKPIDTIIISIGSQPQSIEILKDLDIPVYSIGDCIVPARMFEAFHSGYMLKHEL